MPELGYGPLTAVHDSALVPLGTKHRQESNDGTGVKEYIYLKGVASTVANDVVTFDENFATTRLVPDAVGPVAVALAAVVANKYGWYQIYGNASVNSDTMAADTQAYIDTVSGKVDDAAVTGDLVLGMTAAAATSGGVTAVFLNYPAVTNVLG